MNFRPENSLFRACCRQDPWVTYSTLSLEVHGAQAKHLGLGSRLFLYLVVQSLANNSALGPSVFLTVKWTQ